MRSDSAIMAPVYLPTLDSYGNYMPPRLTSYDVGAARKIYGRRIDGFKGNSNCEVEPCDQNNEETEIFATTKIAPTEEIKTTTASLLTECPENFSAIAADKNTIFVFSNSDLYKIQNRHVVKKGQKGDFNIHWNYSTIIETGYIRNGSLILLDSQKMVFLFDPISGSNEKFQLRNGYPKKTPINMEINGAIVIDNEAHIFGVSNYLIYNERFNNASREYNKRNVFPNFPKIIKGGYSRVENFGTFLTLFGRDDTTKKSQIYRYDMRRKDIVGEPKNMLSYLRNCE
uniref:Uncharacterized protein n=1 Tax=Acrobeloides nanus TaxID=290746 RepID=A0A914C8T2_9BILA